MPVPNICSSIARLSCIKRTDARTVGRDNNNNNNHNKKGKRKGKERKKNNIKINKHPAGHGIIQQQCQLSKYGGELK